MAAGSTMPPEHSLALKRALERAYEVFSGYRLRTRLQVCHCPVCMADSIEQKLLTTPLREIGSDILSEYTNSAHGWDEPNVADDFRYFLPRYLELIAANDIPGYTGTEQVLRRMAYSDWRTTWPAQEVAAVEAVFDALILEIVACLKPQRATYGWMFPRDVVEIVVMILLAGGDLARALSVWDNAPDPGAVAHMMVARDQVRTEYRRHYLDSAYLDEHREEAFTIGEFLAGPATSVRAEAAFFLIDDPLLQQLLSDGAG